MSLDLIRHLQDVRRRAGVRMPRLRRRLPRQIYPKMLELEYARAIAEMTGRAARVALQPLLDELPSILQNAAQARQDSSLRTFAGFHVRVENPRGSVRRWVDSDGTAGETTMKWDYGELPGSLGTDGDPVDAYLGPDEESPWVYVVHQMSKASGFTKYDEDKVMLGFPSGDAAVQAYLQQYDDPRFYGGMTVMSVEDFRKAVGQIAGRKITHRADAGEGKRVQVMVEKAKARLSNAAGVDKIESLARKFAKQTATHHKHQLNKQVKATFGVDVALKDKALAAKIDHFVSENVALIKSLQDKVPSEIHKIVTRAITTGRPHKKVAKDLMKRFDIGESHARLIARDQIGKLYGQVNAARQKELGVRKFVWRTVGDERVREEHAALNGRVFRYDKPPAIGLPGEPIQCRCTAEPVF